MAARAPRASRTRSVWLGGRWTSACSSAPWRLWRPVARCDPHPLLRSRPSMNRDDVLQLIREHLSTELEVDIDRIQDGTRFKEDLEADSLDLVELTMELEDRYGIRIPDEEAVKITTVGQAADFVAAHAPQH